NADSSIEIYDLVDRFKARGLPVQCVDCRLVAPAAPWTKAALYSVAHLVEADAYVCIDADTIILEDLNPLLASLGGLLPDEILVSEDNSGNWIKAYWGDLSDLTLGKYIGGYYGGTPENLQTITKGTDATVENFTLLVNDGVFAGRREALLKLDA